jgi:predicted ABC-type ATPase
LYLPLCDDWMIFDNSEPDYQLVAEGLSGQTPVIYDHATWTLITRREDD